MKTIMFCIASLLIGFAVGSGCGMASAGGGATVIGSPLPGYTCFGIQNGAGDIVGGNCVKS